MNAAEPISATISTSKVVVTEEALRLHRDSLVIDGHNDLPWAMRNKAASSFDQLDISKPAPILQTDIPRLRQGGLGAQFWAAYVPPLTMQTGGAARQTIDQIDLIHQMIARYPETFEMASTADDIVRIHKAGKIASLIGVEGGHSIENSLGLLRMYYRLGVRYMTLTHSESVGWADSATAPAQANGLNDFGRKVVAEMNRIGMLVDISHVSPAAMHAALDVSTAPIMASHSSAYAITKHDRNVPDDILKRIKTNNGIVMVNYFSGFSVPEAAKVLANMFEEMREIRKKFPADEDYRKAVDAWRAAHPTPRGNVHHIIAHIDHIVKVAGIDHVGIGSDYDGITQLPEQLDDVSSYPVITQALLDRGYSPGDIKKVLGENILRVLRDAEKVAAATRKAAE